MSDRTLANVLEEYCLISPYHHYKNKVTVQCIFHSDSHPSMVVDLQTHTFKCYSCGMFGDAFQLILQLESLEYENRRLTPMEVSIRASNVLKGVVPATELNNSTTYSVTQTISTHRNTFDEIDNVYRFYKSLEKINWRKAPDNEYTGYMFDRGYYPDTLNNFHIRVNPCSINPIVIPLVENNIFKGYVARRVDNERTRKYKNNNGLDKKNLLAGDLRDVGERDDVIIVCEGTLDMLKAWQNGFKSVVCLLGCMPSEAQLWRLISYDAPVIWAGDNDKPGKAGYEIARKYFKFRQAESNLHRFLFPEAVHDLGEINDSGQMKEIVHKSMNIPAMKEVNIV